MKFLRKLPLLVSVFLLSTNFNSVVLADNDITKSDSTNTSIESTSNDTKDIKNKEANADSSEKTKKVKKPNQTLATYNINDKSVSIDLDFVRNEYMKNIPAEMRQNRDFDDLSEVEQNMVIEILVNTKLFEEFAKSMNYNKDSDYVKTVENSSKQILIKLMLEKEFEKELKESGGIDKLVDKAYDDLAVQTKGEKQYDITYIPTKDKAEAEKLLKNLKDKKITVSSILKQIIGKGPGKESDFKAKGVNAYYGSFKFSKEIVAQFAKMKNGGFDIINYGDMHLIIQMNKASNINLPNKEKMSSYLKQLVSAKMNQQIVEKIKEKTKFSLVSPVKTENDTKDASKESSEAKAS